LPLRSYWAPWRSVISKKSTNSLADTIPISEFSGGLRRVDPEHQEEVAAMVLSAAFPHFATLDELLGDQPRSQKPKRRFAGGLTLPRGRYYSLCSPNTRNDHGTLVNELLAYSEPKVTGAVEIEDLAYPRWIHPDHGLFSMFGMNSKAGGENRDALSIMFFSAVKEDEETYFAKLHKIFVVDNRTGFRGGIRSVLGGIQKNGKRWCVDGVYIYYTTTIETINNTLDLRQLPAQDFLVKLVRSGELGFSAQLREPLFPSLLLFLLGLEYGGGIITEKIGSWLRSHGVNALIFPSARSDSFLRVRNGVCEDWRHWNLVDYRDAELSPQSFEPEPLLHTAFAPGAKIELPGNSTELRGSFRVDGINSYYVKKRNDWHFDQNMPRLRPGKASSKATNSSSMFSDWAEYTRSKGNE
jgi:hypothetical protein